LHRSRPSLTFPTASPSSRRPTLHVGGVTAWLAVFDSAHLEAGQRLLVQGAAGGVGSIAVQLGRWKGAYVIATASTANVDFVRSMVLMRSSTTTAVNVEDAVHDVDAVVDTVGGEVIAHSWSVLKPGGILVTVVGTADAERPPREVSAPRPWATPSRPARSWSSSARSWRPET